MTLYGGGERLIKAIDKVKHSCSSDSDAQLKVNSRMRRWEKRDIK